MKVSIPTTGYTHCRACGQTFAEGEPYTVVVVAGSAWNNGVAVIKREAELFRSYALCEKDKDWKEKPVPLDQRP